MSMSEANPVSDTKPGRHSAKREMRVHTSCALLSTHVMMAILHISKKKAFSIRVVGGPRYMKKLLSLYIGIPASFWLLVSKLQCRQDTSDSSEIWSGVESIQLGM